LFIAGLGTQLPKNLSDDIEFLEDYQLQIEHALDLVGRSRVLFVDASLTCSSPFEVLTVQPRRDTSYTSHALTPEALLQVFTDFEGGPPPSATVLAIRGEAFELGEPLSSAAQSHLASALAWGVQWAGTHRTGQGGVDQAYPSASRSGDEPIE
jgi:hydrogenase maturation protease